MTSPALPLHRANENADGVPLVFIHGIKGSKLVGRDGRTRWLTAAIGLGLSTPDLSLPIRWQNGRQAEDDLRATEPIGTVDLIPGLIGGKIYEPWLKTARALGRPFYAFAYDWRRDNLESLEKFRQCVEAVRERHGGRPVQLVAHSMGGIISLPLLNERPEWFHHALFAGVPFRGGIGFFEDMHVGLPTGRNMKITSPEMLFTCPSTYVLYAHDRSDCVDTAGNPLEIDLFEADTWVEYGMGIFADPAMATPERIEHLTHSLARSKTLKGLLEPKSGTHPPITVLANRELPTLGRAMRHGPASVRGWDVTTPPRHPGDSRVCYENMMPPDGFTYELVHTALSHSDMLNDPRLPELLTAAVNRPFTTTG
jgi:pimeloyl-ACP methyl ester carboxylesterase